MPSLAITVPHGLDQREAAERLKRLIEDAKAQYGMHLSELHEEWVEHTGSFRVGAMGFKSTGTVEVRATEVHIQGSLPLAAIMFRGRIEETIRQQVERRLT
ncbi:MAG: polyhydroxyalkanoic acid system family protein [Pirellulales bacterium]|nr:polyhydroxyalkanoic acid system family protein [Pirellulales bacterium]